MKKIIAKVILKYIGLKNFIISICHKVLFASYGENITIGRNCDFSHKNIHIGNNVSIGSHASFIASVAHIFIGNNVMFGPNVTIRGGTHRIDVIGEFMNNINQKLPENDQNVIIEEDVWIGTNVTILKGVKIGKGSVVGAGSLVTKNIPSYSIYTGSYPVKIKPRFSKSEIIEHEQIIFSKVNQTV